jgi:predicted RNase H-like HicB family nuclease
MSQRTYRVLLTQEPEGGFTVSVPALPGCITYGESIDHALSMAKEAIELYVETLEAEGDLEPFDQFKCL